MKLYRLSAEARFLVTRDLVEGSLSKHPPNAYEAYLEDPDRPLDLDAFDEVADDLLRTTPRCDPSFDRVAAPRIHRALPIGRREAALPGIWRFLTTVHCPELVRHRWAAPSWNTAQSHYWAPGTRPDSNAVCRLWWIAELTRDGDSYDLTDQVFERQQLATQLFVRSFSQYQPAVRAFLCVMREAAAAEIERVARDLNGRLSTLVLEVMPEDHLQALVRALAQQA